MRTISSLVVLPLLATFVAEAQQPRELLHDVGLGQAAKLTEYNSAFLEKETFFASRYRIVRVDTNLLLEDRDITVTPFDGDEPIEIKWRETRRSGPDGVFWVGHPSNDPLFERTGVPFPIRINMFAWDLDETGTALISAQHRFEFSPLWTFDENDNPVLETPVGAEQGSFVATTRPPRTALEIERHKQLKGLDKHAFFSVLAVFDLPRRNKYVLQALQYTPRYAVIYEIPRDAPIPFSIDRVPGQPEFRSARHRAAAEEYRAVMDRLPKEEGKEIKGDIQ